MDKIGMKTMQVDTSKITISKRYYHQPFTKEIKAVLKEIKSSLDEVFPKTLEDWENGFRQDLNAATEISIWRYIAKIYSLFTVYKNLALPKKEAYFDLICTCTCGKKAALLRLSKLKSLPKKHGLEVIETFFLGLKQGSENKYIN